MLCVVLCIQEKVCKVYFESHLCTDVMYSEWVNVLVHFLLHDILMLFAVAFTLNKYGPYNLKSRCTVYHVIRCVICFCSCLMWQRVLWVVSAPLITSSRPTTMASSPWWFREIVCLAAPETTALRNGIWPARTYCRYSHLYWQQYTWIHD